MKFERSLTATLFAIVVTQQVAAKSSTIVCKFERSCLEEYGCSDREMIIRVEREAGLVTLVTPGLSFEATERVDPDQGLRSYITDLRGGATHLLTIRSDGMARFTAHGSHQFLISATDLGTCAPEGDEGDD